jgi:O-antigen ligase
MTQSLVTPPALAAGFLVAVLPMLILAKQRRVYRLACLACAMTVLLAANSRSALIVAAVLAAAIVVRPLWTLRTALILSIVALVAPFAYGAVRATTSAAIAATTSAVPLLSRSGENDAAGLNSRETVWQQTLERYRSLSPTRQAVGHGPQGHIASGASERYAFLFQRGFIDPVTAGSHSSALQQLLDGGWIGLLLLLGGIAATLRRLTVPGAHDPVMLAGVGLLMTLAFLGASESVVAPGATPLGFAILLVLASGAVPSRPSARSVGRSQRALVRSGSAPSTARAS